MRRYSTAWNYALTHEHATVTTLAALTWLAWWAQPLMNYAETGTLYRPNTLPAWLLVSAIICSHPSTGRTWALCWLASALLGIVGLGCAMVAAGGAMASWGDFGALWLRPGFAVYWVLPGLAVAVAACWRVWRWGLPTP